MTARLLRGVFVAGTDTGVGKTVVSAALLYRLRAMHGGVRYWKPIQTGIDEDDDTATVRWLTGGDSSAVLDQGVRLKPPVSPHLAARQAGVSIGIDDLVGVVAAQSSHRRWIVEGAGGVLVPVNDRERMVDLMARLGLPAVVVARCTLGTINHTLLTLEALRARSIAVAGVVMVGDPSPDNREAIERYGAVSVLGTLPILNPLSPTALQQAASALSDLAVLEAHFVQEDATA